MKLNALKPVYLIILGLLILGISAFNLAFDFPSQIQEYLQQSTINRENSGSNALDVPLKGGIANETSHAVKAAERLQRKAQLLSVKQQLLERKDPQQVQKIEGYIPDRIVIDSIQLDAPVIIAKHKSFELKNQWFEQWSAPDEFAAGWHDQSAPLGKPGNTVLNGHHNVFGEVFGKLVQVQVGDLIRVYSGKKSFWYEVKSIQILKERDASLEVRTTNAEWIGHTPDNRLTLVTCWPKRSNTHRLIVVATPVLPIQNAN